MKKRLNDSYGFTLIELMVVLGILGVLVTLATGQYKKFLSRARQVEAKLSLGALLTSERTFYAEYSSFSTCVAAISGLQQPAGANSYYGVGFGVPVYGVCGANTCGGSGIAACNSIAYSPFISSGTCPVTQCTSIPQTFATGFTPANGSIAVYRVALGFPELSPANYGTTITATTFVAGAAGGIASGTKWDRWTIDQNGVLLNRQAGL